MWRCKACPSVLLSAGASQEIRISSKSWFISAIQFKKWNSYVIQIHYTQTDLFQVFNSFNFDEYGLRLMKTQNSVSQKIKIKLLKTNKKGFFTQICWTTEKYEHVLHSILGWVSFCMNYCRNAALHGGAQSVALLRCHGSPGCSYSGLQLFCVVGSGVSHLPLHNTP